jgi:glycosyltransferase involved in cell wall biosynthesis/predicted HAD superfamily hydrolase
MRLKQLISGKNQRGIRSLNIPRHLARFRRDIMLVVNSGYFDESFYIENNPDITEKNFPNPAAHFILHGGFEGRAPSQYFDAAWYNEAYSDVRDEGLNPLIHFLRHGRFEGRHPRSPGHFVLKRGARKSGALPSGGASGQNLAVIDFSDDGYSAIKASGLFDEDFYRELYPDMRSSGADLLLHYCTHGWREKRNPNEEFNTSYYLRTYKDVQDLGINPFAHWIVSGVYEGRKINKVPANITGSAKYNSPSLIFISHEASRTGAPTVLLTIMRWLKKNTTINFSILIGVHGPLDRDFEQVAPCFYLEDYHHHFIKNELRRFCGDHVQAVYVNSIASSAYAAQLDFLNATYIAHVHEMENVFRLLEDQFAQLIPLCRKYIVVSNGAREAVERRIDRSRSEVVLINPFIDPTDPAPCAFRRPAGKTVIFGCGTVEARKGFDLFCDVAKALTAAGRDDVLMAWIGAKAVDGPDPEVEIRVRGVEDVVVWMGPQDRPIDFFRQGDLFLLPSREDPFPLVCLEAAEAGLPIICFDHRAGGMPTFVGDDAGIVVPHLDTDAMAKAVGRLLDDGATRGRMAETARRKRKQRHDAEAVVPAIVSMLPKLYHSNANTQFDSYKEIIDRHEIISFDIFDTLITRTVSDPNIVFDLVEYAHTVNDSAALPLLSERMETAGRVLAAYAGAVDDIAIDEIYERMLFYKDSEFEKAVELKLCVPHPLGRKIYDYAVACGKTIYIASDMYLDEETIKAMLARCGIGAWDKLFLSSKMGKKKDTGRLYLELIEAAKAAGVATDGIVHIGDNWKGDIAKAKAAGLSAIRFDPLYDQRYDLFPIAPADREELSQIGRIWDGFCTQAVRLWHAAHPQIAEDFFVKLGFEVSGPLAVMMAMHTRAHADQVGARRIVFMARDGRIIKDAFDALYADDIAAGTYVSDYVHLSRATVVPGTLQHPLTSNDLYFLVEGLHLGQKSVAYFLQKAGLSERDPQVARVVSRYFAGVETVPVWADLEKMLAMLGDLSLQIHEANRTNRENFHRYLQQQGLLSEEKFVVVDVGWLLNIQSRLEKFIRSSGSKAKVTGCYVGSRDRVNKSLKHESLLFDGGDPHLYAQFIGDNTTLFEILFSAPEASAKALVQEEGSDRVTVRFKDLQVPADPEFMIAQKIHAGAQSFFEYFSRSLKGNIPDRISKDYFFSLFKALVYTSNDEAKAALNNLDVKVGGQHEITVREKLIKSSDYFEYVSPKRSEVFDPIIFPADSAGRRGIVVTSANLQNGSTRYRSLHLAQALSLQGIGMTAIHAATPLETSQVLIKEADFIVFQRCFEEQGHVGAFLREARRAGIACFAEMDDLIFPSCIDTIGSVVGGEWKRSEAVFVSTAYEKLLRQVDGCIVSTPALKAFIEETYGIDCAVFRNRVQPVPEDMARPAHQGRLKLLYSSGTFSHKEDFALIEGALYDFLDANRSVELSVLGSIQVSSRLLGLPNVRSYPVLPYDEMLAFIARHDVLLVPLVDNVFNEAKSNVKFVEAGSVGVPVLASPVGEFARFIRDSENGLLSGPGGEWTARLHWALHHRDGLAAIGARAQATVRGAFTVSTVEEEILAMVKG